MILGGKRHVLGNPPGYDAVKADTRIGSLSALPSRLAALQQLPLLAGLPTLVTARALRMRTSAFAGSHNKELQSTCAVPSLALSLY